MAIFTPGQKPRGVASRIFMVTHQSGGTDILPPGRGTIFLWILSEVLALCAPTARGRMANPRSDAPASLPDGAAPPGTKVRRLAISRSVLIIEPRRRS